MNSSVNSSHFHNHPCSEFPARCFLLCNEGKHYLSCDGKGKTKLVNIKAEECEWYLIPLVSDESNDIILVIQNVKTKLYLSFTNEARAIKNEGHRWKLEKYPGDKYSFLHLPTRNRVFGDSKSMNLVKVSQDEKLTGDDESKQLWSMELLSGELCYLFCQPGIGVAVGRDGQSSASKKVLLGSTERGTLYTDVKTVGGESGWDIWRFSEAGDDGCVTISSHASDRRLVYNETTDAVTIEHLYDNLTPDQKDKWIISKAPLQNNYPTGVVIQTAGSRKYLFLKRQDKNEAILQTVDTFFGAPCIWQCESANYDHFFIYSIKYEMRIEPISKSEVQMGTGKSKGAVWELTKNVDGSISLYSNHFQRYLGYDGKSGITLSPSQQKNENWDLIERKNGLFEIMTFSHEQNARKYLCCTEEGDLKVIEESDDDLNSDELKNDRITGWYLEPTVPYKITTGMIASSTAKGAAILAPLAFDPIQQIVNGIELLSYAVEAGEVLASSAIPGLTAKPKDAFLDNPDNFKSTSLFQVSQEIARTNETSLGSSDPILNNLFSAYFISYTSDSITSYLSCNRNGRISSTKAGSSDEVWTFDDVGDGFFVRIKSFCYDKYLCYDLNADKLVTINEDSLKSKKSHVQDLWNIERERHKMEGIEIISPYCAKHLQLKHGQVNCSDFDESSEYAWDLSVAHDHKYMLKTATGKKWIVTDKHTPSIAGLQKKGSTWRLHRKENEAITIFSELCGVYLGSDSNGNVHVSKNAQSNEEWILALFSDKKFGIVSKNHGRYLFLGPYSKLTTKSHYTEITDHDGCKWNLDPVVPFSMSNKQLLKSSVVGAASLSLALVDPFTAIGVLGTIGIAKEAFSGFQTAKAYTQKETTGHLEVGEGSVRNLGSSQADGSDLVSTKSEFISSGSSDQKIFCDLFFLFTYNTQKNFIGCNDSGNPFVTNDPKGWSVWRLIHVKDEKYQICSWAQDRYLCASQLSSKVKAKTEDFVLIDEESYWKVKQSPSDDKGLSIQSSWNGGYLSSDDSFLRIAKSPDCQECIWKVEAANRHKFFLLCPHVGLRIGNDGKVPFSSNGMDKKLVWTIEERDGYTIISSLIADTFLGSDEHGKVTVSPSISENEKWIFHVSPHGSTMIESFLHSQRYITCNKVGEIFTDYDNREKYLDFQWKLEPALPQKDEKSETLMNYVTGASAIGLAVANPMFALTAFSVVGFTNKAMNQGTYTSSFSGGESASDVDLFLANEDIKDKLKYDWSSFVNTPANRPFSCWRSWKYTDIRKATLK